jgi:hypothetical protein
MYLIFLVFLVVCGKERIFPICWRARIHHDQTDRHSKGKKQSFFGYPIQGFGSALINADPDTDPNPAFFIIADPDPGFDDLNLKKNYRWKFNFYFLYQILQFIYSYAFIKDAQATGEAFSPQKRTSST